MSAYFVQNALRIVMGYNSTVIIMNDCLNEIRKDQRFGEKVRDAIL